MPSKPRAKLRPDGTCTRCDLIHPKCAAHNNTGAPCGRFKMNGQKVCATHGGRAGDAKRKAAGRIATAEAQARLERAVVTLGLPINVSPTDALLNEVQMTAGHVAWLRSKVQELDPDALVWGNTEKKEKTGGEDWGTTRVEKATPSVWYELYSRERDRLIKVCAEAIRAGIEERRVQLAEQQGALVAEAIRRILQDLDLTADQSARVAEIVPRHLRAIAGGVA